MKNYFFNLYNNLSTNYGANLRKTFYTLPHEFAKTFFFQDSYCSIQKMLRKKSPYILSVSNQNILMQRSEKHLNTKVPQIFEIIQFINTFENIKCINQQLETAIVKNVAKYG